MVISDESRVVQLNGLVEELALVEPVGLELHVQRICGHLPLLGFGHLLRLFSSIFGEMGVEPGADGSDVLVIGEDGKRSIELGK